MLWLYILYILIFFFIFLLSTALYTLFKPVKIILDSINNNYIINFPFGYIKYDTLKEETGLSYRFLIKKGFIPFIAFLKEKKEISPVTKTQKEITIKEKKKDYQYYSNIFKILKREYSLFKQTSKLIFKFSKNLLHCIKIKKLKGTFDVKSPFALGIYYAILGPLVRENRVLLPNNLNKNILYLNVYFIPGIMLGKFIKFLLNLPIFRLYKIYKEICAS